ncbi:hypothetical protein ACPPVO_47020 [Dactylosporangium sp. McL0621]|uniref:hypothetical protein n=1 Tax=Dactylosporangium sp. McL0621 TaxID=3415678 RepID=UPI003CF2BE9F
MAEVVVDGLEVVDVDERDGDPFVAAQRVGDVLGEPAPVGQAGERVVGGLPGQRLHEPGVVTQRRRLAGRDQQHEHDGGDGDAEDVAAAHPGVGEQEHAGGGDGRVRHEAGPLPPRRGRGRHPGRAALPVRGHAQHQAGDGQDDRGAVEVRPRLQQRRDGPAERADAAGRGQQVQRPPVERPGAGERDLHQREHAHGGAGEQRQHGPGARCVAAGPPLPVAEQEVPGERQDGHQYRRGVQPEAQPLAAAAAGAGDAQQRPQQHREPGDVDARGQRPDVLGPHDPAEHVDAVADAAEPDERHGDGDVPPEAGPARGDSGRGRGPQAGGDGEPDGERHRDPADELRGAVQQPDGEPGLGEQGQGHGRGQQPGRTPGRHPLHAAEIGTSAPFMNIPA